MSADTKEAVVADMKDEHQVSMIDDVDSSDTASSPVASVPHKMTLEKWLACIALGLSYTTAIQQMTATGSIVKHIDIELGPTTYYNWILSAHSIVVACVLPLAGGLSDIFGRRYFFVGGCLFSITGTAVALSAKDIKTVIAGMAIKGVGSGAQQLALAAIGELVPNKHRGTAQAILDLVGLPWMIFGPLIGNSMVKYYKLSFRINFIIGIILNFLTMVAIWFWYHPPAGNLPPGMTRKRAFLSLDWIGVVFLAAGISLTLVGIAFGGTTFSWKSAGVIAPIVIGVLSFLALYVWESRVAKRPFFPPEIFSRKVNGKSNRFAILLLLTFVGGMSLFAQAAFFTQEAQMVFTRDPTKIGLSAIPLGAGAAIGGFLGGILLGRGRIFRPSFLIFYGTCFKIVADGLLTTVTGDTYALFLGSGFLAMFGTGILMIASIVVSQLTCSDEHIGMATLLLGSVRAIGGSLAVTVYAQIMQITAKEEATKRVPMALIPFKLPPATIGGIIKALLGGRPKDALAVPGVSIPALMAAGDATKVSMVLAFRRVYQVSIAFTALALIASLFIRDVTVNMTDNVAVKLENEKQRDDKPV